MGTKARDQADSPDRQRIEEKEYLKSRAEGLRQLLREMKLPQTDLVPESQDDAELGLKLIRLSDYYTREMDRCLETAAFLGANVMGASILETLLLMACLRDKGKVSSTNKWQSLQKKVKPRPFQTILLKARLTDLLLIAKELSWFPNEGITPRLRAKMAEISNKAVVDKLCNAGNSVISITAFMMAASAGIRNILHPARCVQIPVDSAQAILPPTELMDYMAMLGCLSVLLALGSFIEHQTSAKG